MCPATALPRDPEAMSRFVIGPLREAVEETVGEARRSRGDTRAAPYSVPC